MKDANDHQPLFHNKTYAAVIPETFSIGDLILQLNATDKDEGENGRVVYEFDQSVPEDVRRNFVLDSHTGKPCDLATMLLVYFMTVSSHQL